MGALATVECQLGSRTTIQERTSIFITEQSYLDDLQTVLILTNITMSPTFFFGPGGRIVEIRQY